MQDVLRDIKKELRAAMNGIASQQMRQAGMPYRVIFGVEIPRLQAIAREFVPSRELAQTLWNESVRESKLLACMLMPAREFLPEVADIWIGEAPTAECIQHLVFHLLRSQPWAAEWSFRWIASSSENHQLAGILTLTALLRSGVELNEFSRLELQNQAESLLPHASLPLKKAILNLNTFYDDTNNLDAASAAFDVRD